MSLPTVGSVWRNKHNGDLTTVTKLVTIPEHGIGYGGVVRIPEEFGVEHSCAVPPGYKRGHPQGLARFLEHWEPGQAPLAHRIAGPGRTLFCDHCGGDLAYGHNEGCPAVRDQGGGE